MHDIPHVDLTQIPTQGAPHPPPGPEPFVVRPPLRITTNGGPLERRSNSDSPGTEFYTPGGSSEVTDRSPFNSAVPIRVIYSRSVSRPGGPVGPFGRVVGVHQQWNSMHKSPTQATPVSPKDSTPTDSPPRHGIRMSLPRPPKINIDPPSHVSGAKISAIPDHALGRQFGTGLTVPDEQENIETSKEVTIFPRKNVKRALPGWDSGGGKEGDDKEGDGCSCWSKISTDDVSGSGEDEGPPRASTSTPVSAK